MPGPPAALPRRRPRHRHRRPGLGPPGRRRPARSDPRGQHRPGRRPNHLDAELLARLRRPLRPGRGGRDLHQPVPALAPRATTPACNWPDASNARPTRCGCSPPDPTCHPRTTARNRRSAGSNSPPRSKAAGAPWPPCSGIAGSGPTWSAPATTDADPSTPSATP